MNVTWEKISQNIIDNPVWLIPMVVILLVLVWQIIERPRLILLILLFVVRFVVISVAAAIIIGFVVDWQELLPYRVINEVYGAVYIWLDEYYKISASLFRSVFLVCLGLTCLSATLVLFAVKFRDDARWVVRWAGWGVLAFALAYLVVSLMEQVPNKPPWLEDLWLLTDVAVYVENTGQRARATIASSLALIAISYISSLYILVRSIWAKKQKLNRNGYITPTTALVLVLLVVVVSGFVLSYSIPFNIFNEYPFEDVFGVVEDKQPISAFVPSTVILATLLLMLSSRRKPLEFTGEPKTDTGEEQEEEHGPSISREEWLEKMSEVVDFWQSPTEPIEAKVNFGGYKQNTRYPKLNSLLNGIYGHLENVPDFVFSTLDQSQLSQQKAKLLSLSYGAGKSIAIWTTAADRILTRGGRIFIIYSTADEAEVAHRRFSSLLSSKCNIGASEILLLKDVVLPRGGFPRQIFVTDIDWVGRYLIPDHSKNKSMLLDIVGVYLEDIEQYSGVKGANAWAILRRLWRTVALYTRQYNVLATMNSPKYRPADYGEHARRLCGKEFDQIPVASREPHRDIWIYPVREVKKPRLMLGGAGPDIIYYTIVSGEKKVAVSHGYSIDVDAWNSVRVDTGLQHIPVAYNSSRVVVAEVTHRNLLMLIGELFEAGSLTKGEDVLCVVTPSSNLFVRFIVEQLEQGTWLKKFDRDHRSYFCDSRNEILIRKQLLLALEELSGKRRELENSFDSVTQVKLVFDELDRNRHLVRDSRPELDEHSEHVTQQVFFSTRKRPKRHSLDTISEFPVVVHAKMAQEIFVLRYVDAERLTLDAYEGKVIRREGRRYQVGEWPEELLDLLKPGAKTNWASVDWSLPQYAIPCIQYHGSDDIRPVNHVAIKSMESQRWSSQTRGSFSYSLAKAELSVEVSCSGYTCGPDIYQHDQTITAPVMHTQALLLDLGKGTLEGLLAFVVAIEEVLPVYIGVEPQDFLVKLCEVQRDGKTKHAIAVIDAFPGGTGLVTELKKSVLKLLDNIIFWFQQATCCSKACTRCVAPAHITQRLKGQNAQPDRSAALEMLSETLEQ